MTKKANKKTNPPKKRAEDNKFSSKNPNNIRYNQEQEQRTYILNKIIFEPLPPNTKLYTNTNNNEEYLHAKKMRELEEREKEVNKKHQEFGEQLLRERDELLKKQSTQTTSVLINEINNDNIKSKQQTEVNVETDEKAAKSNEINMEKQPEQNSSSNSDPEISVSNLPINTGSESKLDVTKFIENEWDKSNNKTNANDLPVNDDRDTPNNPPTLTNIDTELTSRLKELDTKLNGYGLPFMTMRNDIKTLTLNDTVADPYADSLIDLLNVLIDSDKPYVKQVNNTFRSVDTKKINGQAFLQNAYNSANREEAKIAIAAINLTKNLTALKNNKNNNENYENAVKEELCTFENSIKDIYASNNIKNIIKTVICAAIGFALGVAVGFGVGFLAGVWTGPGAIVTAAMGAIVGAAGVASGITFGVVSSQLFFKPSLNNKAALAIVEPARQWAKV